MVATLVVAMWIIAIDLRPELSDLRSSSDSISNGAKPSDAAATSISHGQRAEGIAAPSRAVTNAELSRPALRIFSTAGGVAEAPLDSSAIDKRPIDAVGLGGWFLMVPPLDLMNHQLEKSAALKRWSIAGTFNTRSECIKSLTDPKGRPIFRTASCVAADDSRLRRQ